MENISNNNQLKGIKFHVTLNGRGGVNYDGAEQKDFLRKHCGAKFDKNENGMYLKKAFYIKPNAESAVEDEYGNKNDVGYHLKISANCLRREIFEGCSDSDSVIWLMDKAAVNFITNPLAYMRGYMCANKEIGQFNKKGCVTVTDAIDTEAVISDELFTKSGTRDETSLFHKETVGDTKYEFDVFFDVATAQFLSNDDYFGRKGLKASYIEGENLYGQAMQRRYGRLPYTCGVFSRNNDIFGESYGEDGLLFDDEYVNSLIRRLVHQLYNINIVRSNGYAATSKVEMCPVYDGISNGEFSEIKESEIDGLNFAISQFYRESSHLEMDERKAKREAEDKKSAKKKEDKKAEKDRKKREKAEKAASESENETGEDY